MPDWTGGKLDVTDGTFTNQGTLDISGFSDLDLGGTLTNSGVVNHSTTRTFFFDDGAVIDNDDGGVWDIQDNVKFNTRSLASRATFNNKEGGTFIKTGGGGIALIDGERAAREFECVAGQVEVERRRPGSWASPRRSPSRWSACPVMKLLPGRPGRG